MNRTVRLVGIAGALVVLAVSVALVVDSAMAAFAHRGLAEFESVSPVAMDRPEVRELGAEARLGIRSPAAAPASVPRESDTRILTISLDTDRPIPGIHVVVDRAGVRTPLGVTDAHGTLVASMLERTAKGDSWVGIQSDEYCCERIPYTDAPEVVLRLAPGTVLEGRVVDSLGRDRGCGDVTVVAVPVSERLTIEEAEFARRGASRFPCVRSDPSGSFRLGGVTKRENVVLLAGGQGQCMAPDPPLVVQTARAPDPSSRPHEPIVVPVFPVVGARLVLSDDAGSPIRVPEGCDLVPGVTFKTPKWGLSFITWRGPSLVLAGVAAEDLDPRPPVSTLLFENVQRRNDCELGLVLLPKGYSRVNTTIPLADVANGLATYAVRLATGSAGFGALELEIQVPDEPRSPVTSGVPSGSVLGCVRVLDASADFDHGYSYPIRSGGSIRTTIQGIAHGTYEVSFVPEHGLFTMSAGSVVIGTSPAQATLDLRRIDGKAFGSLRIDATREDGMAYDGPLQVELRVAVPGAGIHRRGAVVFQRAPYFVSMLPEGTMEVLAGRISDFGREARPHANVGIRAGEVVVVGLTIAPERR